MSPIYVNSTMLVEVAVVGAVAATALGACICWCGKKVQVIQPEPQIAQQLLPPKEILSSNEPPDDNKLLAQINKLAGIILDHDDWWKDPDIRNGDPNKIDRILKRLRPADPKDYDTIVINLVRYYGMGKGVAIPVIERLVAEAKNKGLVNPEDKNDRRSKIMSYDNLLFSIEYGGRCVEGPSPRWSALNLVNGATSFVGVALRGLGRKKQTIRK